MWSLMIHFRRSPPSRRSKIHQTTGKNCASRTLTEFLLRRRITNTFPVPLRHATGIMRPSAAASLTVLVTNTTLPQFPVLDKLQMTTSESQWIKRARPENLLQKTRGTMILKSGKKVRHRPENEGVLRKMSCGDSGNRRVPLSRPCRIRKKV